MNILVRTERASDVASIRQVHEAAFPTPGEARLVDALRDADRLAVSWVAECDGRIIGHVAFSPVTVVGAPEAGGLGLGPLAVLPEWQRKGIGSLLVRAGLDASGRAGCPLVVVLGHPDYYPRFGFEPAARHGLGNEYGAGDAFQVLSLRPGAIPAGGGMVRYAAEFALVAE